MNPTVVYWNNIPSPYVVERFNTLHARGNLRFEAWFNQRREPDRSWDVREADWQFPSRYIPARTLLGRSLQLPLAELLDRRPDLLVSLYASASFAGGIAGARALGARTAIRVLPTFDTWVRRSRAKEFSKRLLFRAVDGAKVPGPDGEAVARRYGIPAGRIVRVTQSVDLARYATARDLPAHVREAERRRLGLIGCTFIYVGRLWRAKGLDYLFDAFARVRTQIPQTTLLVVGDGVDEPAYRERASHVDGIVFTGFVQPAEIARLYGLADVSVFPTLGDPHGLVIEEAMAAGLPVISSDAAGDVRRRLPDGQAGYVVPAADAITLATRMLTLASDTERRRSMSAEAARLVIGRGHDAWASDFETFVDRILALPRRRTAQALAAGALGRLLLAAARDTAPAPKVAALDGGVSS
ncbi:MAG: glycosyltransferase family 4 protein [Dehalococcoidia bacterium]